MKAESDSTKKRIYSMSLATVYPIYVAKAERKNRTKAEVDEIICWLTRWSLPELKKHLTNQTTFEQLFKDASLLNPARKLIKGVICGVRVEEIHDPIIQEVRYLDKLIDELAQGRTMEKILRK